MFERLYRVDDEKPTEEIHKLLGRFRRRVRRHHVTLGSPPFVRNNLNRITAIRLRFTPLDAAPGLAAD